MRDIIVTAAVKLKLNNVPDNFSLDDIDCLTQDIIGEGEEYVNNTYAAKELMWEFKTIDEITILSDKIQNLVPVDPKVKRFCSYCGLDLREVDWDSVTDDGICPNCGEELE